MGPQTRNKTSQQASNQPSKQASKDYKNLLSIRSSEFAWHQKQGFLHNRLLVRAPQILHNAITRWRERFVDGGKYKSDTNCLLRKHVTIVAEHTSAALLMFRCCNVSYSRCKCIAFCFAPPAFNLLCNFGVKSMVTY